MGRAVDPLRQAGHDHRARSRQRRRELAGHPLAVGGHPAGPDHGDTRPVEDREIAVDPERIGRRSKLAELRRIAGVLAMQRDHGAARMSSAVAR